MAVTSTRPVTSITNGYNKWTSNSDDTELVDVTTIDGGVMEGVSIKFKV